MAALLTIFTPTYNRAHTLPALYKSLVNQEFRDFEWVIVDDGSTDNTSELVAVWMEEKKIPIIYRKVENRGKAQAINRGLRLASGELFFVVDSDDYLTPKALLLVLEHWEQVKDDSKFAGIAGYCVYPSGEMIGTTFTGSTLDTDSFSLRYVYGITGDKAEVYRTEILKQFSFPKFKGEKFVPEALVHLRIAKQYDLRWFNQPTMVREYLAGGLTHGMVGLFKRNPKAYEVYYQELLSFDKLTPKQRFIVYIKYTRQCFHAGTFWLTLCRSPRAGILFWLAAPLGWLYYLKETILYLNRSKQV